MLRTVLTFFLACLLCVPVWAQTSVVADTPLVSAQASILLDRQTGLVLWEHNADQPLPMASTTKIMTAMVILDHGGDRLNDVITVSQHAASTGGSSILAAGDALTLESDLKAALICSSNEATVAAAEFLTGGHPEQFVQWMNDKARDLGLTRTHFVNPHGLFDHAQGQEHYTTARELALIARYALTYYPEIRKIIQLGVRKPEVINVLPRGHIVLWGRDRILGLAVPGVPGSVVDGVKTGYVNQSGKCLVSSASRNGWQLIAVVLNSPECFKENLALLNLGFTRYHWVTYADPGHGLEVPIRYGACKTLAIGAQQPLGAPVPDDAVATMVQDSVVFREGTARAPVAQNGVVGSLDLLRDGQVIASAPAIALTPVALVWWRRGGLWTVLCIGVLLLVSGMGLLYGTRAKNARRRRRLLAQAR